MYALCVRICKKNVNEYVFIGGKTRMLPTNSLRLIWDSLTDKKTIFACSRESSLVMWCPACVRRIIVLLEAIKLNSVFCVWILYDHKVIFRIAVVMVFGSVYGVCIGCMYIKRKEHITLSCRTDLISRPYFVFVRIVVTSHISVWKWWYGFYVCVQIGWL